MSLITTGCALLGASCQSKISATELASCSKQLADPHVGHHAMGLLDDSSISKQHTRLQRTAAYWAFIHFSYYLLGTCSTCNGVLTWLEDDLRRTFHTDGAQIMALIMALPGQVCFACTGQKLAWWRPPELLQHGLGGRHPRLHLPIIDQPSASLRRCSDIQHCGAQQVKKKGAPPHDSVARPCFCIADVRKLYQPDFPLGEAGGDDWVLSGVPVINA